MLGSRNLFPGWGLTAGVLKCIKSITSNLDWLLKEDRSQGIHCDVESERDESENTQYQCDR